MSEATTLKGKPITEKVLADAKAACAELLKQSKSVVPKLVSLKVGENEATDLYIKSQQKACERVGAKHEVRSLKGSIATQDVEKEIQKLNQDSTVSGVIVQMPLPKQLDPDRILNSLDPAKDVEGMHPHNLGLLMMNRPALLPCTPAACVELIKSSGVDLYGKEVVVVGASVQVGKPISILLLDQMATVTMCRSSASKAGTLEGYVKRADILVAALGKPQAIRGSWIKVGAVVIDVGINQVDGLTVGDVEFEIAKEKASAITPVPGGVGPVTVAILMQNLMKASKNRQR